MMDTRKLKILVAVDGSSQSLDAVRYVAKMLPPQKTNIMIFHVMRKISDVLRDMGTNPAFHSRIAGVSAWESTQTMMIQDFMKEARKVLIVNGFPEESVTTEVRQCQVGIARDIIAESARGYDAVVVGRRGLSRLMDIMMGSIAHKLMEKMTGTPVWIIGGTPWIGKVILGLDPSPGAMRAVGHVGKILGGTDTEATLLSVIRSPSLLSHEVEDLPLEKQSELFEIAKEEIDPIFEKATNVLTKAGFAQNRIVTNLITGVSSRAGTIVEEAKKKGCGTIVMGRRGMSKLEEFFIGSVSNKVINLARDKAVWVVN